MLLDHFKYDTKLKIIFDYFMGDEIQAQDTNEKWENVELSKQSIDFLVTIFRRF